MTLKGDASRMSFREVRVSGADNPSGVPTEKSKTPSISRRGGGGLTMLGTWRRWRPRKHPRRHSQGLVPPLNPSPRQGKPDGCSPLPKRPPVRDAPAPPRRSGPAPRSPARSGFRAPPAACRLVLLPPPAAPSPVCPQRTVLGPAHAS